MCALVRFNNARANATVWGVRNYPFVPRCTLVIQQGGLETNPFEAVDNAWPCIDTELVKSLAEVCVFGHPVFCTTCLLPYQIRIYCCIQLCFRVCVV